MERKTAILHGVTPTYFICLDFKDMDHSPSSNKQNRGLTLNSHTKASILIFNENFATSIARCTQ
uniref:Uncharacterized protein n=1 Tax=Rhizophora mucronata TaxID=61149 RepID=A0A2P2J9D9_RHIMU